MTADRMESARPLYRLMISEIGKVNVTPRECQDVNTKNTIARILENH